MFGHSGWRIGRVFGIELRVDPSWLFVLVLLVWNLSSVLRGWHPGWAPAVIFASALVGSFAFFASVVLHELAHSLVAVAFGIRVRRILLFMLGGVSDIEREPASAGQELLVAVVGPLTSVALGVTAFGVASLLTGTRVANVAQAGPVATLLLWLGPVNVAVGVFNLLPGFPLDGGRILRALLWAITRDVARATRWAAGAGLALGALFVVLGGIGLLRGRGLSGLWLAFIGWFLTSAAMRARAKVEIDLALAGVSVARVMRRSGAALFPSMPLAAVVGAFLRTGQRVYPVIAERARLVGMIDVDGARAVPEEEWGRVRVADAMRPRGEVPSATPEEPVVNALARMAPGGVVMEQLPVVNASDELVGLLDASDVERFVELHAPRAAPPPTLRHSRA